MKATTNQQFNMNQTAAYQWVPVTGAAYPANYNTYAPSEGNM